MRSISAVDLCYRAQPFTSELQRVEYLFALYEKLTAAAKPWSSDGARMVLTPV